MVFGLGGGFIYAVDMAFLGPEFITGMCRAFAPNANQVWVMRALDCARFVNATIVSGFVSGSEAP